MITGTLVSPVVSPEEQGLLIGREDGDVSGWASIFENMVERELGGKRVDALEHRFALLSALRPNWDGPATLAPPRAAISVVYGAALKLGWHRQDLSVSAHGDGYVAVTRRDEDGTTSMADVWGDHIEYYRDGVESSGPLRVEELSEFLAHG